MASHFRQPLRNYYWHLSCFWLFYGVTRIPGCRSYHSHARRIQKRPQILTFLTHRWHFVPKKKVTSQQRPGESLKTESTVTFFRLHILNLLKYTINNDRVQVRKSIFTTPKSGFLGKRQLKNKTIFHGRVNDTAGFHLSKPAIAVMGNKIV